MRFFFFVWFFLWLSINKSVLVLVCSHFPFSHYYVLEALALHDRFAYSREKKNVARIPRISVLSQPLNGAPLSWFEKIKDTWPYIAMALGWKFYWQNQFRPCFYLMSRNFTTLPWQLLLWSFNFEQHDGFYPGLFFLMAGDIMTLFVSCNCWLS